MNELTSAIDALHGSFDGAGPWAHTGKASSHVAFFDEIRLRARRSEQWHSVAAGLVVLRLVDAVAAGESVHQWGWSGAQRLVKQAHFERKERATLARLLEMTTRVRGRNISPCLPSLLRYARVLELDSALRLAVDVYDTVLRLSRAASHDTIVHCHLRLGFCYGALSAFDEADRAYALARAIALSCGDRIGALEAEVGIGETALMRGNIPLGEEIVMSVLRRARGRKSNSLRARALHVSAAIAALRGDFSLAIQRSIASLRLTRSLRKRNRTLGNLAAYYLDLGYHDRAELLYGSLASNRDRSVRWLARLNLLQIASTVGERSAFERHARILARDTLTPEATVAYHIQMGEGFARFHDRRSARSHLSKARALAVEHGLHRYAFLAEAALQSLDNPRVMHHGRRPPAHTPAPRQPGLLSRSTR